MAEARFIAAADLHLGRPIASLPEALRQDARTLGPFGALERLVRRARSEAVDAVLLAGDVVDDDGAYFEVFSALQQAVRSLEGIPVLAIAGNHDAQVLPRLVEAIDGIHLLGSGGAWSSRVIPTAEGDVEILGWSFPDKHCAVSPFATPPPPRSVRRIGILHGDLDATASVYAPVTRGQLRTHAADAWLLGHVHTPSMHDLASEARFGYLGSACGLDPSEDGPRGAWMIRCDAQGVRTEHVPLAPLVWVRHSVDVGSIDADRLDAAVQRECDALADRCDGAEAVGVRLVLTGTHPNWARINKSIAEIDLGQPWEHRGRRVFLDKFEGRVLAPLPLDRLAQERSAAGRIAGLILELQSGGASDLVRQASEEFSSVGAERNLRAPTIGERQFEMPDARATLMREAQTMLSALLAQSEGEV